ncbi:hypothetical protein, partial [Rhodovulum imhoffii]|uniref:hypothetical protein n=1 Tax=Rhodovulum imhoffii TaxID=365340 RepID=UPI001B87ED27
CEHCETHSFSSDAYQLAMADPVGNVGRRHRLHECGIVVGDVLGESFRIECTSCCVDGSFEVFDMCGELGALRHDIRVSIGIES